MIWGKDSSARRRPTPNPPQKQPCQPHAAHRGIASSSTSATRDRVSLPRRQHPLEKHEHKYAPVHGNGGRPVFVEDKLIFSLDGGDKQFVVALDKATGKSSGKRPQRTCPKFSFSTPLLITANGRKELVSSGQHVVAAYDPKRQGNLACQLRRLFRRSHARLRPRHALPRTGYDSPKLSPSVPMAKATSRKRTSPGPPRRSPHAPSLLAGRRRAVLISDRGVAAASTRRPVTKSGRERVHGATPRRRSRPTAKSIPERGRRRPAHQGRKEVRADLEEPGDEKTLASYAARTGRG